MLPDCGGGVSVGASAGAGDGALVRSQSCRKVHRAFIAEADPSVVEGGAIEVVVFVVSLVISGSTHKFKNEHHSSDDGGN